MYWSVDMCKGSVVCVEYRSSGKTQCQKYFVGDSTDKINYTNYFYK